MQRSLLRARSRGIVPAYVTILLNAFAEQFSPDSQKQISGLLIEPLTDRESEVLELLLEGASNREIAERLVISVNTVKRHVYNLCCKMGVRTRLQAIVCARSLKRI